MTCTSIQRYSLTKHLLEGAGLWSDANEKFLNESQFEAIEDGGMGSFKIVNGPDRVGTRDASETKYIDSDDIDVVIALIVDDEDRPAEVDFWKVDSSPLVTFPDTEHLDVKAK